MLKIWKLKPVTGDHIYLFISLFTGSPTEQDKTQQIVTLVETAHASFTGGPFFAVVDVSVVNAALNAVFFV